MAAVNSSRILVSGVSGPIGEALLPSLKARGYTITRLVRDQPAGDGQVFWNPAQPLSPQSVSGFEAVIHLAGETIVGRWTKAKKARIRDSRVLGTRHLAEALAKATQPPRVLISASAIGYYGDRGEEILQEDSRSGTDFLSEVCREWEAASQPAVDAGIRTVQTRFGLALSPTGGALQKMLLPFRMGLGGKIGSGRQWWSWIDVKDLVGAIHHVLRSDLLRGPVNLVAPKPVRNDEFSKILATVLSRPSIFPMPAFAARLALGQMADELLLASQQVEPAKLIATGYSFQHADLKPALEAILQ
ncbi:MAG: TIGR01777 family protein [Acidobacteriales bacterium 13_2_20CM_55_8]|nr:MAG: TIGR01777 family protein [Acidobacteriales bacterium 13_2_20CM_55_8]